MRKIVSVLLVVCLTLTVFAVNNRNVAYADPIALSSIAGITMAVGSSLGIDWTMTGVTSGFTQDWMTSNIERYDNGQSLIDAFVNDTIRVTAGKIAIGYAAYNAVCDFIDWIRNAYNLNNALIGTDLQPLDYDDIASSLNGWAPYPGGELNGSPAWNHYYYEGWSKDGAKPIYASTSGDNNTFVGQRIEYHANKATAKYYYSRTATKSFDKTYDSMGVTTQTQSFSYPDEYILPTVLNPTQGWEGNIDPTGTDTNLEDLVGDIFSDAADNNLDVDGEIIDIPVPPGPVPTWTPVDDVIDGINQGGEVITDIGNDIGDISGHLDDLGEIGGDIVDQLEGVNQGIQTQTGVLSGAIDQAVSDVQDAISEQTQTLSESATATAEATESIAEALEDEAIDWQKFDLRGLFPFCIPFDIYNMLEALDATPTAPHVQLPFVIESIGFSYTIDLDFSAFDQVAAVMRTMELIVYGIALAWATSKVIKW